MSAEGSMELLQKLLDVLDEHRGESGMSEGAIETLRRIITERDLARRLNNDFIDRDNARWERDTARSERDAAVAKVAALESINIAYPAEVARLKDELKQAELNRDTARALSDERAAQLRFYQDGLVERVTEVARAHAKTARSETAPRSSTPGIAPTCAHLFVDHKNAAIGSAVQTRCVCPAPKFFYVQADCALRPLCDVHADEYRKDGRGVREWMWVNEGGAR